MTLNFFSLDESACHCGDYLCGYALENNVNFGLGTGAYYVRA